MRPPSTRIGELVRDDPRAARAALVKIFAALGSLTAVAQHMSVQESTVARWIGKLKAAGLVDPRVGPRGSTTAGVRGPRAAKSELITRAETEPDRLRRELKKLLRPVDGEGARRARIRVGEAYGVNEITVRRVLEKLDLRQP